MRKLLTPLESGVAPLYCVLPRRIGKLADLMGPPEFPSARVIPMEFSKLVTPVAPEEVPSNGVLPKRTSKMVMSAGRHGVIPQRFFLC